MARCETLVPNEDGDPEACGWAITHLGWCSSPWQTFDHTLGGEDTHMPTLDEGTGYKGDPERTECCGVPVSAPCLSWCVNAAQDDDEPGRDTKGAPVDYSGLSSDPIDPFVSEWVRRAAAHTLPAKVRY